jgi:GLPGLI family protein
MPRLKKIITRVLTYIFIFNVLNSFSQVKSGQITYTLKMDSGGNLKRAQLPINIQKFMKKTDSIITTLEFTLKFNRKESLFAVNNSLVLSSNEPYKNIAVLATRGKNKYYVNLKDEFILEQTFSLGELFLVKIPKTSLKWKLINEQKKIKGYLCYKAQAIRENSGPLKKKDKYSTYIAWYCPSIPFNYGPFEVTGLPGLVLKLSNGKIIYTASEIKLNKENIEIKKPSKGKEITKKELENLGKKAYENSRFLRN